MMLENVQKKLELLEIFNIASPETWFTQDIVAAIRNCSIATVERDRWAGKGVPFIKCGRSVRYSKATILTWLAEQSSVQSTTEAEYKSKGGLA